MMQAPPPSWYADPDGSGGLRYWDGEHWTQDRAPRPPAPGSPADLARLPMVVKGFAAVVVFDGRLVRIVRSGWNVRWTVGEGETHIPLRAITSIGWKKPGHLFNGYLFFGVDGRTQQPSAFGRDVMDAARDKYSVIMTRAQEGAFLALRAAIEGALAEPGEPPSGSADAPPAGGAASRPDDVLAWIRELGELRDRGVVTAAEFEAKKADLLGRL